MKARTLTAVAVLALPIALAAQTAQPAQPGAQRKPTQAARTPLEIRVTSRVGDPLAGVTVTANGAVVRSGRTDDEGVLMLRSMPAGLYRLRFTDDGWITLERDVTVRGAATTRVEVVLSPAEAPPPPPPQPAPAPAPAPTPTPAPAPAPSANVEPKTVFIPDFIDQNFLGRAPRKDSVLGCTPATKTTLLQLREPLGEHTHADGDEVLYVVAGEATHKVGGRETRIEAGTYSLVPRGVPHSLTRRGTNPIVLLLVETGQPCASGVTAR